MKQLFFTLLLLSILSCKENMGKELIKGDIYIKLIDVNNILYSFPEEDIEKFKKGIANGELEHDKKFIAYHKILIDNNLVKEPHFKLKIEDGKIINVYTNKIEYEKLSKHLEGLDREKEKITVKLEGVKISDGIIDTDNIFNQAIYKTENIIIVNKTEGKTNWDK